MQGGVRRKNDLLPRYRNQGGSSKRGFLTTPMKKMIMYVIVLLMVWMVVKTTFMGGEEARYELETTLAQAGIPKDALEAQIDASDAINKVPKERFNNEVAKQQETKNLENEYKSDKLDTKKEIGNSVRAVKQQEEADEPIDEQARRINEKAPFKKIPS
ncbi:LAMI_0D01002g1_1 [Lachancea mirantina]|uniref:LAMI_0D01002g1_1 n=1 Tax=Lachancea mirantina TaxID=1230905 RepID=A0A1G4J8H2_9SACH|nr:LAMI_0D01002g1_1 [Lachancea mirantina]